MKKRWISLLLVACTLLSLFPTVIFAASAESLPKDESALGDAPAAQDGASPEKTVYDSLYVGAFNMNLELPDGEWIDYFTGKWLAFEENLILFKCGPILNLY